MPAMMVVTMDIRDDKWIAPYFAAVPAILARHGGVSIAASRDIRCVEGDPPAPQRVAIFRFPSLTDIERFLADEDYCPFRESREAGAKSRILVFENAVMDGELV